MRGSDIIIVMHRSRVELFIICLLCVWLIAAGEGRTAPRKANPEVQQYFGVKHSNWAYFVRILKDAGESPLNLPPGGKHHGTTWRIIWARSFHDTIVLNVCEENGERKVRVVRLSSDPRQFTKKIIEEKTSSLDEKLFSEVTEAAAAASFSTMPVVEDFEPGKDGSSWLIEGASPNGYHAVDRWGPTYNNDERNVAGFVKLGKAILACSPIDLSKERMY